MLRTARLTSLALATGTLVAAGAGPAPAATRPQPRLAAAASGSALVLTVHLPRGVSLPGIGSTITQTIALTDTSASTLGAPAASASAVLGKGATPVLSALLDRSTHASLGGRTDDATAAGPSVDSGGLVLDLLPLRSTVADPATTAAGVLARSSSGVGRAVVSASALPAQVAAPVTEALQTALAPATGAAGTATGQVAGAVNSALDQLHSALSGTPAGSSSAPLTGAGKTAVTGAINTLDGTLTSLTGTLQSLRTATSLVSVGGVTSGSTVTRAGDAVTSTVTNGVTDLEVLSGLVSVKAITSTASATAGGVPGTGRASFTAPVLDVKVAQGALDFLIDGKGAQLRTTATEALPADLKPVVQGALGSVNGLLDRVAGVRVQYGRGAAQFSPDGTSATSRVSATTVTVNPAPLAALLPAGTPFMTLQLVSAQAAAGSRLVAAPATVPARLSLPRTGADLPLTGAVACALLGAGLVLRRSRRA